MTTQPQILATLRALKPGLRARYPLHALWLFGSWARGDATPDSDVDVLVDVDASIGLRIVNLADELEAALGCRVDVVTRRAVKAPLWQHIEKDLIPA